MGGAAAAPPNPGGFGPPPGGGVNPLGGTMAIDQLPNFTPPPGNPPAPAFPPPAGGPPGGGFGAPAADPNAGAAGAPGGGFGAPPAAAGGFGAPQGGDPNMQGGMGGMGGMGGGYGQPPGGGYGQPPGGGYGQPPGGGYGQPQGGGFGQPDPMAGMGGGMGQPQQQMGYGQQPGYGMPPGGAPLGAPGQFGAAPMGMGGGGFGGGAGGPKGQMRNPVMTLIIGMVCGCYALWQMWSMLNELQAYTRDDDFKPWFIFIPFLGIYFMWIKVPEQIRKAKQMSGCRNPEPQSIVLYIFLGLYALSKDLNEVWDPSTQGM